MIKPVADYSYSPVALPRNTSFGQKLQARTLNEYSLKNIVKDSLITIKMAEYVPVFKAVASLFGKELVYNEETGKLSSIIKIKKGVLQQVKHFYPNGRKLKAVDEYTNGKLAKTIAYRPDGKTIDWTVEYARDKDVTIFYYPDGKTYKTAQIELNDGSNRMQIKRFNQKGQWIKTENYQNDVLIDDKLYCDDFMALRIYNNGNLASLTTVFKKTPVKSYIPEGDQRKNPLSGYVTTFDDNGKPIETTISAKKSNGESYISGRMTYPDKDTIKLTRFKEDGKDLCVEIINQRSGKRNVTYSKG